MLRIAFSTMLLLGIAVATPVLAGSDSLADSRAVQVTDLDLSRAAGIAALDKRLDRAIAGICGAAETGNLKMLAAVNNCRKAARAAVELRRATMIALAARKAAQPALASR